MPQIAGHHVPTGRTALFATETLVVLLAARLGWELFTGNDEPRLAAYVALACATALQGAFYLVDLYDLRVATTDARRLERLILALVGAFAVAIPAAMVLPDAFRMGMLVALACAAAGSTTLRAALPLGALRRRIFVVGGGQAARLFLAELRDGGEEVVVGACRPWADDIVASVMGSRAQSVVVACDNRRGLPPSALLECRVNGVEIVDALTYIERTRRKLPVDLLRPGALIYDDGFRRSKRSDAARRAVSLVASGALALLALPLAILCAIAIRLGSPGPVLYKQARVGRRGRVFVMLKFRTMRLDAEAATGPVWALERDQRVTRVGAFLRRSRLDELPQLINVLKGDMDLVGPRPERPEFVQSLAKKLPYYELRALVRPGLTGWAQIRYRYGASLDDARQKLAYDLYYVKHASVLLDAIVLFHTAKTVLLARGSR